MASDLLHLLRFTDTMPVLHVWSGPCHKREARTGAWTRQLVVVSRARVLYVLEERQAGAKRTDRPPAGPMAPPRAKLKEALSTFDLALFKLEVGSSETVAEAGGTLFFLFLVRGHLKISFGFESKQALQVIWLTKIKLVL